MTLIEIMIVVAIIATMAAAVAVAVIGPFHEAQEKTVAADFKALETQLDLYSVRKGALPAAGQGLQALVDEGITRELPKDPWNHPYQYSVNGSDVTLTSLGSDGQPGGSDTAADISKTIRMR